MLKLVKIIRIRVFSENFDFLTNFILHHAGIKVNKNNLNSFGLYLTM